MPQTETSEFSSFIFLRSFVSRYTDLGRDKLLLLACTPCVTHYSQQKIAVILITVLNLPWRRYRRVIGEFVYWWQQNTALKTNRHYLRHIESSSIYRCANMMAENVFPLSLLYLIVILILPHTGTSVYYFQICYKYVFIGNDLG